MNDYSLRGHPRERLIFYIAAAAFSLMPLITTLKGWLGVGFAVTTFADFSVLLLSLEPPQPVSNTYQGDPVADLMDLRQRSIQILTRRFPEAEVDSSGAKSVSIEGGSLRRKIDVVSSNWRDTNEYARSGLKRDRAMNDQTGQSEVLAKQYPRRCAACGSVSVQPAIITYDAKIKHDGKLHEFKIDNLPIDRCEQCEEVFFTNETSDAKSHALREHLGLLQPSQIRELLKKHSLTQRKFAEHLHVAEESVSRWINGLSIQSRALDTFMRIYFAKPEVREMLDGKNTPRVGQDGPNSTTTIVESDCETQSAGIHAVFQRRFTVATLQRSQRFRLVPSRN